MMKLLICCFLLISCYCTLYTTATTTLDTKSVNVIMQSGNNTDNGYNQFQKAWGATVISSILAALTVTIVGIVGFGLVRDIIKSREKFQYK
ncbi:hypothetical protein ABK040_006155 [Willaertia magna]